jgi:hypothetical protein
MLLFRERIVRREPKVRVSEKPDPLFKHDALEGKSCLGTGCPSLRFQAI